MTEAVGKAPADYCRFSGGVVNVTDGKIEAAKSEKDALTIDEDGFLGPFANDGDKVSWQVAAPWAGKYQLQVTFSGKWGGKKTRLSSTAARQSRLNSRKPMNRASSCGCRWS